MCATPLGPSARLFVAITTTLSASLRRQRANRTGQQAPARQEAGPLQRPARRRVGRIAARSRALAGLVAHALSCLYQVAADPPAPGRLGDLHEDVAIGRVVVAQEPAGRHDGAVRLDDPVADGLMVVLEHGRGVLGRGAPERAAGTRQAGGAHVVEQDALQRYCARSRTASSASTGYSSGLRWTWPHWRPGFAEHGQRHGAGVRQRVELYDPPLCRSGSKDAVGRQPAVRQHHVWIGQAASQKRVMDDLAASPPGGTGPAAARLPRIRLGAPGWSSASASGQWPRGHDRSQTMVFRSLIASSEWRPPTRPTPEQVPLLPPNGMCVSQYTLVSLMLTMPARRFSAK